MIVAHDDPERFAWLGQAESDLHEAAAIDRHDRQRYEARIADAEAHGWLTPDEVREALGRPRKGTPSGPAAPPTPASSLPGEGECAAPEAGGGTRQDGAGPDVPLRPGVGEADQASADPRPVPFRALSRIARRAWGRK